ncbi:MAG: phage portal protein [Rhodobacteraceae bacterium]|nr:MAG: phage portal protein [Paracoccaceae bacterium]
MAFPFASLFRRRAEAPVKTRALEAAGGGTRWATRNGVAHAPSAIRAGAATVARRAQDFVLNDPIGTRAAQVLPDNLVGAGIKPIAKTTDAALRKRLASAFDIWTDRADATGEGDFFSLTWRSVQCMVVFGEGLVVWGSAHDGAPQLTVLDPEQLDRTKSVRLSDTRFVEQGVEFDTATARPVAYWIRPSAPGGMQAAGLHAAPAQRIPAAEVIHLFRPLFPGQVRGLSWFAPILLGARDLNELIDAAIVRAKVAAMHAGYIRDPSGGGVYSGKQTGDTLDVTMEPGTLNVLRAGEDIVFPNVPDSGDVMGLAKMQLHSMAAAIGLTYEQLSGDFSDASYSSARSAHLEFRRFAETVQHHVIVHQLCRPVWSRFMRWQVLQGTVAAADYVNPASGLQNAKWLPPAWPWIDPAKDAKAAIMEIDANLKSRSEVIAARGYDAEDVDAEIAADRDRARRLNIEESTNAA